MVAAGKLGVLEAAVAAMRLHPASGGVQLQSSWTIHNIVWNGTRCAAPRARAQPASLTLALAFLIVDV